MSSSCTPVYIRVLAVCRLGPLPRPGLVEPSVTKVSLLNEETSAHFVMGSARQREWQSVSSVLRVTVLCHVKVRTNCASLGMSDLSRWIGHSDE